jgi:1-acyl-sn-glycerol-3-phosphate acyltransferase
LGRLFGGKKGLDWIMSGMILTLIGLKQFVLLMPYKFINFRKIPYDKPVLFVSNHQSMWDIPPLMWRYRKNRPRFIAKKELGGVIPSVSFYLKYANHLLIDRSKSEDALIKIKEFADNIDKQNYSIVIYPEGTRSKDGKIAYFRSKGIKAILEKMPDILIVPIAQHNTREIDNNGKFFKKLGITIKVEMLEPRHFTLSNLEEELSALRIEMCEAIGVDSKLKEH